MQGIRAWPKSSGLKQEPGSPFLEFKIVLKKSPLLFLWQAMGFNSTLFNITDDNLLVFYNDNTTMMYYYLDVFSLDCGDLTKMVSYNEKVQLNVD